MSTSINKEHMEKIADELGFKIKFNSDNPGVKDLETGKIYSFEKVLMDFFSEMETKEFSTKEKISQDNIKSYSPVKILINREHFFFVDEKLTSTNIAS